MKLKIPQTFSMDFFRHFLSFLAETIFLLYFLFFACTDHRSAWTSEDVTNIGHASGFCRLLHSCASDVQWYLSLLLSFSPFFNLFDEFLCEMHVRILDS